MTADEWNVATHTHTHTHTRAMVSLLTALQVQDARVMLRSPDLTVFWQLMFTFAYLKD